VVFFVFLLYLGTVPTVWYFLFFYCILGLFRQCGIFCFPIVSWDCSDSVVFFYCILELFRHWYFLFCVLWYHWCLVVYKFYHVIDCSSTKHMLFILLICV
jgi:hypothetical protein